MIRYRPTTPTQIRVIPPESAKIILSSSIQPSREATSYNNKTIYYSSNLYGKKCDKVSGEVNKNSSRYNICSIYKTVCSVDIQGIYQY